MRSMAMVTVPSPADVGPVSVNVARSSNNSWTIRGSWRDSSCTSILLEKYILSVFGIGGLARMLGKWAVDVQGKLYFLFLEHLAERIGNAVDGWAVRVNGIV